MLMLLFISICLLLLTNVTSNVCLFVALLFIAQVEDDNICDQNEGKYGLM